MQPGPNAAISSEWHVHFVKDSMGQPVPGAPPSNVASRRQLCIQCPNGRKHSSIFVVQLLPHWLNPEEHGDAEPADVAIAARQPFKDQGATSTLPDDDDEQDHVRITATLENWLTEKR